ncbi:hypothetical protein BDP27DRAFT_1047172 [Rhodocollybia butyracea]|uniref:ATP synthase F0 subunit 8 n=1 Tax=Rhodocollybia butyracea TaxID=206335 RepID=A0A9P5PN67_9AGAR|nr:hypothetical protein BDP27DRAFT_1047172 [Rhodocollybia butyracea]
MHAILLLFTLMSGFILAVFPVPVPAGPSEAIQSLSPRTSRVSTCLYFATILRYPPITSQFLLLTLLTTKAITWAPTQLGLVKDQLKHILGQR